MRIVKQQACSVLQKEISQLVTQCQRCNRQVEKLSSLSLAGVSGKSVDAAEERMRMQASVAQAHRAFFGELLSADRKNLQLVTALPETSPGVLDTNEAQERMDQAQRTKETLERQRDDAVARAQSANALAMESVEEGEPVSLIDVSGIATTYQRLIAVQENIIKRNERILLRARQYERDAAAAYHGIETSYVVAARRSTCCYLNSGTWGEQSWTNRLSLHISASALRSRSEVKQPSIVERFIAGDLTTSRSVCTGGVSETHTVLGIEGEVVAKGSAFGMTAFAKPYAKSGTSDNDGQKKASVGAETGVRASVAEGQVGIDWGLLHSTTKGSVLGGAVSGSLGASLYSEGEFNPSAEAKLKGNVHALRGEQSIRLGTDDLAYSTKASGEIATAKVEAGMHVGSDGIEVSYGSEAYTATGELSTGITVLGVSVSIAKEGKLGGKGAAVGARIAPTCVEGRLAAGLGVGAGVKVKVDWSGLGASLSRWGDKIRSWEELVTQPGQADAA